MYCSYKLAAGRFHTMKLCSRRFSTKFEFYWQKQQNRVLCHPSGDVGVTYYVHGSSMARWKVLGRLPVLVLIELFSPALKVEALGYMSTEQMFVKIVVFERSAGHFERKFQGEGGSSNISWRCLRDPTFSRF